MNSAGTPVDWIYLDHNATTPVDPEVLEAMLPYLRDGFGNPSSSHPFGRRARAAVDRARADVARLINAEEDEIIFTSGGTEASQLALIGAAEARRRRSGGALSIVSFSLEHPATLMPLDELKRRGDAVTLIPPDSDGVIRLDMWREAAGRADIASLMLAHNETGAIQPVAWAAERCRAAGAICHTDAAQAVGKVRVDVRELMCDLLTIAGHKLYAPKGIGALYVRRGTEIVGVTPGAGQERGLRGGTENVPGIVALGKACELAEARIQAGETSRLRELREQLWIGLKRHVPEIARTSERVETLPNTLHVRFPRVRGNAMLELTQGIAAGTGSACHSGVDRPPSAITAMGIPEEKALGSVRLSLGHSTDAATIERAIELLSRGWRAALGGNGHGLER